MRAGLLLRIAIYIIGLSSLHGAITDGVYYLGFGLSPREFGTSNFDPVTMAGFFGHGLFPLLFALGCFGFGGAIERGLLGSAATERVELSDASVTAALRVGIKLLGVYVGAIYLSPLIATLYESLSLAIGRSPFEPHKTASDLIANGMAVAFASACCFRTEWLLRALHSRAQHP